MRIVEKGIVVLRALRNDAFVSKRIFQFKELVSFTTYIMLYYQRTPLGINFNGFCIFINLLIFNSASNN